MLPYFAGERTPILDPDARGTITGLTLRHGSGSLYRASLEGIAYAVRHNLETMGPADGRVVAVGGGTRSELWLQIVSDVTGLPQEVPAVTIGASYGDALLVAEGVGLMPAGTSWSVPRTTVTPRLEHRAVYDELYEQYLALHLGEPRCATRSRSAAGWKRTGGTSDIRAPASSAGVAFGRDLEDLTVGPNRGGRDVQAGRRRRPSTRPRSSLGVCVNPGDGGFNWLLGYALPITGAPHA